MKLVLVEITGSKYAIYALDWIFKSPIFTLTKFIQGTQAPRQTATRIIERLIKQDVLVLLQASSGRNSKVVGFPALLNIVG